MVETIARGILCNNSRVLLSKKQGEGYYALVGGHIEEETLQVGLKREFKEETNLQIEIEKFLYLIENAYRRGGRKHYEVVFYFLVRRVGGTFMDRRDDATLSFIPLEEIKTIRLLPPTLKEFLLEDIHKGWQRRVHLLTPTLKKAPKSC